MAETDTQNMSIALYRYMCQEIIGTDEQVKAIRMMNNIKDFLNSHHGQIAITSGSFGEGLVMRGSDFDKMYVYSTVEVSEDVNIHFIKDRTYFKITQEDTPPCYIKLRLLHSNDPGIHKDCVEFGQEYYYSSASVKQGLLGNKFTTVHGPCVTDKSEFYDLAVCICSKSWITPVDQWITRSNNGWPDNDVKQSIAKHGVLFVPIGVKGSKNEELEWRISFSVGEKLLIYTFTHTQLLSYSLMKILIKDVINVDPNCKDLLCSYFIKTVIFWISEELSTSIWEPKNLISCFMRCFRRLIYFVEYSVCPHYFIPNNNLFENKIKGQSQQILLNKVNILNSYGWQCILFSGQISNFCNLDYEVRKKPNCFDIIGIKQQLSVIMSATDEINLSKKVLQTVISRVMSIRSSKIKYLYTHYLSKLRCVSNELLPLYNIYCNKCTYKHYKSYTCYTLLSTHHDAVSGWLSLATFFYTMKQYKIAAYILQYCLFKCTPEKLYRGMYVSHTQRELVSLQVFRNMATVQLLKFLHLEDMLLDTDAVLIPAEFQIEGYNSKYFKLVPPVVYAHFLLFLCHYHLNNTRHCRDSLLDLQLTIEENYFIKYPLSKSTAYNILGITFQLSGDRESARQSFF